MSRPARLRVLVVDDSGVARRFITGRLERDHDLEVVGAAASGAAALELVAACPPDAVVLDEEMPGMSGRDVLRRLRKDHPEIAVVMFSARVGQGTMARFEALYLGADDAVAKPRSSGGPITDAHPTWTELLVKIKRAARRPERGGVHRDVARGATAEVAGASDGCPAARVDDEEPTTARPSPVTPPRGSAVVVPRRTTPGGRGVGVGRSAGVDRRHRTAATGRRPSAAGDVPPALGRPLPALAAPGCVVVASSTGGPDALGVLFAALGSDFPLPVLVVQHMPPVFTQLLAERLDSRSALTVREASGGEQVRRGQVLVAPGDHHLQVATEHGAPVTVLGDGPPENSCRPAADVLFRSATQVFGRRLVGVVLSGMGQDGMLGSAAVRAAGGCVLAQDEATSVVWGMPGAVAGGGHADAVLPIEAVAAELTARARTLVASPMAATAARGGSR